MPHSDLLIPMEKANFTELKIAPERTEPLFWVCEVRFLSNFSPEPEYEIRRISFRKGLNIIWAMPPKEFNMNDEQRIAGHATGKTTLCRMIRYLLGESNFGNEQIRTSIYQKFPNGYVVGHIRIDGIDWCVARPFAGRHGFALQMDSLDDFLKDETQKGKYENFKDALSLLLGKITAICKLPGHTELTFNHLLPFFTRDQDSQFTKLAEWRDNSLSEAASPVLTQKSAMLVMRSLISDIVGKESELLATQEELDVKVKNTRSSYDILKIVLAEDRNRLRGICHDNAEDAAMDQLYISAKLEECIQRLSTYCIDSDDEQEYQRRHEERDNALLKYTQAAEDYNASLRKYRQNRREYNELKKMSQKSVHEFSDEKLDEIQTAALQLPTRRYCCVPMEFAIEHHCPWAVQNTKVEDTDSKENLIQGQAILQDEVNDHATELHQYYQFLRDERERVLSLQKEYESIEKDFNVFCAAINQKRNKRAAEEGYKLEAVQRYDMDRQRFDELTGRLNQLKEDLKNINTTIATYRNEANLMSSSFSFLYDKVIRYIMGSKVAGRVKLNEGNIKLESSYHSAELQSAALDTVKIICFDIAIMIYSIMGNGTHPRFLMHDGPRVSDVTRSIYLGYFKLMRDLEFASKENPNFQYIITTTEPPPEELQKVPWLICRLDATDTQNRLLKCNLD